MAQPLMPKATAVWLLDNTKLTFRQIAEFCGLHPLEIQAIADGEAAIGMIGFNPITNGQLTMEEIARCEVNPEANLELRLVEIPKISSRKKSSRYTPVKKRGDKPDAIAWILKNHPEMSDTKICRLIGTTRHTINGIRDRTHWNMQNIKPQDPVSLGLVSREDLNKAIEASKKGSE